VSALPDAEPQSPACGACHGDTELGDDGPVCYDCQLAFDPDTFKAEFLDPDAKVCGADCDNYWHNDHKIRLGWGYHCGTCQLPSGHTKEHWTGCDPVEVELIR